jgi:hypothetical protein
MVHGCFMGRCPTGEQPHGRNWRADGHGGAHREQVMWMVLRDSLVPTAVGAGLGGPFAILLGKALTSTLYAVKPYDADCRVRELSRNSSRRPFAIRCGDLLE